MEMGADSKDFFKGLTPAIAAASYRLLAVYFLLCGLYLLLIQFLQISQTEFLQFFIFQFFVVITLCILWVKGFRVLWGWRWRPIGISLSLLMAYFGLLFALDQALQWRWGQASGFWPEFSRHEWVAGLIVAPIVEELFFRAYLFRAFFMEGGKLWRAILLSSLFFMLAHLSFHLGAFLLGVVSAFLYWRFRSLVPCILFHFGSNLLVSLMPVFLPALHQALGRWSYFNF